MSYILNAKKSQEDSRDFIYCNKNFKQIPSCVDYRDLLQPIRNQGSQGTCYAQSAACMKELQEKYDYNLNEYLSPQFFYNNREYWNNDIQDGEDINEDYGMTGRDVMRILKNIGICKESEYPYGTIEKIDDIPAYLKVNAYQHRINNYARINTMNDLKTSLIENGACLIAFPVYNYSDQMWIQNDNEQMTGGHAMTVVGYDDKEKHFIIRNSWGKYWGDNGYCYYKYKDWDSHWECWTTIDIESNMNSDTVSNDTQTNDIDSKDIETESESNDCVVLQNGDYKIISEGANYGLSFYAYNDYIFFNDRFDPADIFFWDGKYYKSDESLLFTYNYHGDDTMYTLFKDGIEVVAELIPKDNNQKEDSNCWKWFKNLILKKKN
tara:strand:- start:1405 stop:2541 length:1137 start_codon:yes stop_codon:yes gene_type:complete